MLCPSPVPLVLQNQLSVLDHEILDVERSESERYREDQAQHIAAGPDAPSPVRQLCST